MESYMKSIISRSSISMNAGACVGLQQAIAAKRDDTSDNYKSNPYIGENFYEKENFRAALERMNQGYDIAMDFIEMMQDHCDLLRTHAQGLYAHHKKWIARSKQQSAIASYHTTKRAQFDTVRAAKRLAPIEENRCNGIQAVIDRYRKQIGETYERKRFGPGHVYRRAHEFRRLFRAAHSPLAESTKQLETLRVRKTKAREAQRNAKSACEIVDHDPTTTEKQRRRVAQNQGKIQNELTNIEEELVRAQNSHIVAKELHCQRIYDIFQECQQIEEERLNQIKETLHDFCAAIHTQKLMPDIEKIYNDLSAKINIEQDSHADLLFWAQTYGVYDQSTTASSKIGKKSMNDEIEASTTTDRAADNQQDTEDENESSVVSTIEMKSKSKRTKNTAAVDKKINMEPTD